MQKEKEKKISKVEALQNCDCGSFLSTFLLLVLCTAQRSVGFFLRVGCNLCTLVGSLCYELYLAIRLGKVDVYR